MSNKYSQRLFDSAKKSTKNSKKSDLKRAIQKTAEATGDLIGNKTADKITKVSKTSQNALKIDENKTDIPKEKYISPEKRQQIVDELRLI